MLGSHFYEKALTMAHDTYEPEHCRMMGEADLLKGIKFSEVFFVVALPRGQAALMLRYLEKRE